jgi:hypothetical protein
MRDELKHFNSKQITLEDGSQFYYTIQPFEMKNILGTAIAVLDEYVFTKKGTEEIYKLYRTNEGNWYDVNEENNVKINAVLRSLKSTIDCLEINI